MSWADDDVDADPETGVVDDAESDAPAGPPPLLYGSVDQFVDDYLSQIYRRQLGRGAGVWCAEWWRHAEAVARLEAMWRAFEKLRRDPGEGGSTWWLSHADPHMAVLLSSEGPFRGCTPEHHSDHPLLPLPTRSIPRRGKHMRVPLAQGHRDR